MLNASEAILIFIDVQGKLHEIMSDKESLDANLEKLVRCAQLLEVPIIATEQLPEKLGRTNDPFQAMLADAPVIAKSTFSCCGKPAVMEVFKAARKKQVILIGIETHVCVYQTAVDMLELDHEVFIAADAVASRAPQNKALILDELRTAGAQVLPTETLLFALLRDAADPRFKELLRLIK